MSTGRRFLVAIIALGLVAFGLVECVSEFAPSSSSSPPTHWTKDTEDTVWNGLNAGFRKAGRSNPFSRDCVMGIIENDFPNPQSYEHAIEKHTSDAVAMLDEIRNQC
jgi:hypothetical protein